MMGWQWHQLDHMQIIRTLLQTDNHTSTSPLSCYRPDALPATQPTVSKHWRHYFLQLPTNKVTSTCHLEYWQSKAKRRKPYLKFVMMSCSSPRCSGMARVKQGSHSFTCHPTCLSTSGMSPAFTPQPQSVTSLLPLLISRLAEGRRLSHPSQY